MPVKIAAVYAAQPDADYLESSLRSVQHAVERIQIGVTESAERAVNDVLAHAPDLASRIEIIRGNWNAPEKCVADLARTLIGTGTSYVLVVDPQDVYAHQDLTAILSFVEAHPDAGQFQARIRHYWKSPSYRIDPPDPTPRPIIFSLAPASHTRPSVLIPEDIAVAHNFSFASPTCVVDRRLRASGLAPDAVLSWQKSVWDVWNSNRALRNLHPQDSSRFRSAQRIQHGVLPQRLAGHRHLGYEIVGEETRRNPVCSAVFIATQDDPREVADFGRRLAASVPDDCELVGCSSRAEILAVLASIPGVKAVRVSEDSNRVDCWFEGSQVANSDNLVFLTSEISFEGDWIEGFIAAFERNSLPCVFVPENRGYANSPPQLRRGGRRTGWCRSRILSTSTTPSRDREGIRGQATRTPNFELQGLGSSSLTPNSLSVPQFPGLGKRETTGLAPIFEKQRGRFYGEQTVMDGQFDSEAASCWACTREALSQLQGLQPVRLDDTLVFHHTADIVENVVDNAGCELPASIVIPIFNNLHFTKNCLASIFQHTAIGSYELVVVDNGSTDGSWEFLQELQRRHSQLRCIRNRRNLFFARGCNRGGWAARGENIVFLNNDTIVKPGWLEELLKPLTREDVGITGNKQLFPDSHPACPSRVWHAGMVVGNDKLTWHVCYGFDPAHPAVNRERECQSVSGCCLAIRRDLFEELGGFDPIFQNGFEDVDLCLRARELGYRVVYAPRSEIIHFVSSSESRFDREAINLEKFKARWSGKLVSDEEGFLRETGLLPEPEQRPPLRVGFISTFHQKSSLSRYAERLLEKYPQDSYVVLSEFGTRDRRPVPDAANVIRCWDRTGTWYYPLLRWATTLELDLIHVNFDSSLFPLGFLELLQAVKNAGKRLVFTIHQVSHQTPLLEGIARLADAVIVEKPSHRALLVQRDFIARTVHVIPPGDADHYWSLYNEVLNGSLRSCVRIRWEGPQLVNHSLALVNREMEGALLQSEEVELTIAPVGKDTFAGSLQSAARTLPPHYGRPLSGPVDVHVRHQWPPNWEPPSQGHWVVIQPWEYGGVPQLWLNAINRDVDELWAPSTFVRNVYVDSGVDPHRVHVVPNGVDTDFFKPGVKPYPLKGARKCKFLFLGGTIHRKGIDVLLDAYIRTFKATDDVTLIVKDMGASDVYRGQGFGDRIREMQSSGRNPHILYLDRDLTDTEMVQLYNACDCLVHPYRGEGFALPVLEAMSCALPVIVTAGGATDDFVDDRTGFRIPARKVVFGDRLISGLKTAADLWLLEPDGQALSDALAHVYNNQDSARGVGRRARTVAETKWTWRQASEKALERVQALSKLPILRHLKQVDAAVLLDLQDDNAVIPCVESLKRNSYASLAVFVRAASQTSEWDDLRRSHPDVTVLAETDFRSSLHYIRERVRAPHFALITEPLRFSKNWLKQLAEAAARNPAPRIIVPSLDSTIARERDDSEFQRLARLHWRQHRGIDSPLSAFSGTCLLVDWECLSFGGAEAILDAKDWAAQLERLGVRAYLAEDTCVGLFQTLSWQTTCISHDGLKIGGHATLANPLE